MSRPDVALEGEVASAAASRWAALAVVALAQLMVALDATIVSVALPSAQAGLHASDADRQWMVTAYTVAFAALLLAGGRIADRFGRRRTFVAGLAGFAAASAAGGSAPSFALLVAARAAQGAFAAVLTPTALSLISVTFVEARERATAFALYGAIAGSGAAAGMLLGGVLTQYLSWRWCLYVNVPIAVFAALGGRLHLPREAPGTGLGFDLTGMLLGAGGMVAIVEASSLAVGEGWRAAAVPGLGIVSLLLLVLFVLRERSAKEPMLPLRILLDRRRGGAHLAVLFTAAGIFGAFLLLTYYLQSVLRFTPLQAGLAFLPLTLASQAGSWLIARALLPRLPARAVMAPAAVVAGSGLALLTRLDVDSGYWQLLLPAETLLGIGTSCLMVPAFSLGTLGVERRLAGVAAASLSTAQQVGGSLGTALLNALAVALAGSVQRPGGEAVAALVRGFRASALAAAIVVVTGGMLAALLMNAGRRAGGDHGE